MKNFLSPDTFYQIACIMYTLLFFSDKKSEMNQMEALIDKADNEKSSN